MSEKETPPVLGLGCFYLSRPGTEPAVGGKRGPHGAKPMKCRCERRPGSSTCTAEKKAGGKRFRKKARKEDWVRWFLGRRCFKKTGQKTIGGAKSSI